MNNLIIGDTSQLSPYFPSTFDRISSRNIDFKKISLSRYDKIFLLFAEQRTFLNNSEEFFNNINFYYTINVINKLKELCNKIIIFSTAELWNDYGGCISLDKEYKYNYSPYIKSKEILCNHINYNRDLYNNVIIIYPFNFNSMYRKEGFLFGKVFDSLLNDKKISIGNVDFYRDLIHPKVVVELSLRTKKDIIIGSGELINVKDFITDIFKNLNKNILDYIEFDASNNLKNLRKEYYSCDKTINYIELINLTIKDYYEYKIS
jgi:nucleoside-diphosphate-sugar epimerase